MLANKHTIILYKYNIIIMNDKNENASVKIILLGESGVGKTNLINAFFGGKFEESSITTTSSCFEGKISYKNNFYNYNIWDTAGQEQYRAINKLFLRNAKIILIVYSIVSRQSFNEINYWINYVKENLGDGKYIMGLVANKNDLYEQQIVNDEEGEEVAKKYGIEFTSASALIGANNFQNFINKLIINYIEMSKGNWNKMDKKKNIKINKISKGKKNCC